MNQPIRILQINGDRRRGGGILNVILSWHRRIDRNKVQFDYLTFLPTPTPEDCNEEIQALGGNTFYIPFSFQHPFRFIKQIYRFFKTHHYTTVHSHVTHLNFVFFPLAKWFGTKNIVQHAHGTQWGEVKSSAWRNYLMLHAVWPLITHKLACSQAAGEFWYGKNFTVINNAVDMDKFDYNPAMRAQKRRELGVENNFVLGNVGWLTQRKNPFFLLDIFEHIIRQDASARLIWVGRGVLEEKVKALAVQKNLQDKVLLLGARKDVAAIYQALDVLCMPSIFEGLPVVGVEAQAAGLPCVFADTITPEVLLLPGSVMLSLNEPAAQWAEKILAFKNRPRVSGREALRAKGFDVCQTARQMQDFYEQLGN